MLSAAGTIPLERESEGESKHPEQVSLGHEASGSFNENFSGDSLVPLRLDLLEIKNAHLWFAR